MSGEPSEARRYWGWRIAWTLAVTQTVGYGILFYAFAVFTLPMELELGLTRAQTSGAFSLALLVSGLAAVPAGRWVDAHGARWLMAAASAAGALLVLAWSFVSSLPALYAVQAGIGVVMACALYDVAFTVIATWFRRDRMRAMLVVTLVAGLASTIFVPLATALVEGVGWRAALRVLALVLALVAVPLHALVLRRAPGDLGLHPDGGPPRGAADAPPERSASLREAFRARVFWWLSAAFAIDRIVIVAVAAHAVPMLLEQGHSPALVASAVGSIGLLQVLGRAIFAPSASKVDLARLTSVTFVLRAVGVASLLVLPGVAGIWVFAGLFGLANGATTLARAGMVAETFGARSYGAISGSMTTLIALAQTVAPLGVGALRAATGSYRLALVALVVAALLAAVASEQVRRDRRRAETAAAARAAADS